MEALFEGDSKPVSNGSVTPLPPSSWAPTDIPGVWLWAEELVISVPEVEISAMVTSLVLAGRDLNVLPSPLVAVVEMEVLVVGKSKLNLSIAELLDGWWLLPMAIEVLSVGGDAVSKGLVEFPVTALGCSMLCSAPVWVLGAWEEAWGCPRGTGRAVLGLLPKGLGGAAAVPMAGLLPSSMPTQLLMG